MSNEHIRLDKAIEANANGIKTLEYNCELETRQARMHEEKAETYRQEIMARVDMGESMKRLQNLYGDKESIYFVIPNVS